MQVRGQENQVPQMPRSLLSSGHAKEDTRCDAVQRSEDDIISSFGGFALYIVEIKSTDIIQFRANLFSLGRELITITTMRTVSLAILSSFIATFLMVQKKNLSEAGRRIDFKEYDPYI